MLRNCLVFVAIWIALVLLYAGWLWTELPPPMHFFGPLIMGSIVWLGVVMVYGARNDLADWRAQRRMSRGEPPRDGDLVSAIGPIRPAAFEPLTSPVSGRECVLYSYTAGTTGGGARACAGFGMTRCSVQTAHGQLNLGTFPVLEGFPEERGDDALTEAYLSQAEFEDVEVTGLVKAMFKVHSQAPPLKMDLRTSTNMPEGDLRVEEHIVAPGTIVTAIGRYVAANGSIIGGTREGGYLRLFRGGDAQKEVSAFPGKAVRGVIVGLLIIAAANAALVWVLGRMPPR